MTKNAYLTAAEIVEIKPYTIEEGSNGKGISEAYIKLKTNAGLIEVNVYLKSYFLSSPKSSKWGVGQQLINNLTGKSVDLELCLVDLEPFEKTIENKKVVHQNNGSADSTTVQGQVIEKEEYNPADYQIKDLCPDPNKYEKLILDCGVEVKVSVEKGLFNKGDFVVGYGILQAHLKKVGGDKV